MITQQQDDRTKQYKFLAQKMRKGSGVGNLMQAEISSTHYADSLQRFQKDFASYDRLKRQEQKQRKQAQIQKKRLEYLERQNKRWQLAQQKFTRRKQKQQAKIEQQTLGIRKTANSNSLAYNPINLSYDKNSEGQKLKYRDQQHQIRGYVRAHNMDYRGNSKYNPLNGGDRVKIQSVVPNDLSERYQQKKRDHYESLKVHVPSTAGSSSQNPRTYY